MRTVDDFAEIRRLHRDGVSARQIARRLRVGRDTIRKALADPEPKPYTLAAPRPAPSGGTKCALRNPAPKAGLVITVRSRRLVPDRRSPASLASLRPVPHLPAAGRTLPVRAARL